jgi:hypothetical protein
MEWQRSRLDQFASLLPPHHQNRPWSDDPPLFGCGSRRLRLGRHFLQRLVESREVGWPLLLDSRRRSTHRWGFRVRLGQGFIGSAAGWLAVGGLLRQSLPALPRIDGIFLTICQGRTGGYEQRSIVFTRH